MTNKEAFIAFRQKLVDNLIKEYTSTGVKASGNFENFISSEDSAVIEEERFIQYGTNYTSSMDVGRGATVNKTGGLFDGIYKWLQYKKYGISYENDKQRKSIAFAITKKIGKEGSFKRRNTSARTEIVQRAIEKSLPTLRLALSQSIVESVNSDVLKEVRKVNQS